MDLIDLYLAPFGQFMEPAVVCSLREVNIDGVPVPCASLAVWDVLLSCPGRGTRVAHMCDDHAGVAAAGGVRCGEHGGGHTTVTVTWRRGGAA